MESAFTPHRPLPASPAFTSPRLNGLRPTPPPRQSPRIIETPRLQLSPPVSDESPRFHKQSHRKRPHTQNAFRSARLQSEIAQLERQLSGRAADMTPEDALLHLRRILPSISASVSSEEVAGVDGEQVLRNLASACWKTVSQSIEPTSHRQRRDDTLLSPEQVLYSQLLRGIESAIRERLAVRSDLYAQLHAAATRTRELPRAISDRQGEMTEATAAFMARTARALHCQGESDVASATADVGSPGRARQSSLGSALCLEVHERLNELRRRRELRAWACGELRSTLNDLATHATDLKKQIAQVVGDVKVEEVTTKEKSAQIEHINMLLAAQSSQYVLSDGRIHEQAASEEATSPPAELLPGSPSGQVNEMASSTFVDPQLLQPSERVERARERHTQLLIDIEAKRAVARSRTEQVFDVRRVIRELENEVRTERSTIADLEAKIDHVERAYTPRPNWDELKSTTMVTTAVDRGGRRAKLRRGKRNSVAPVSSSKNNGGAALDDEDEASERRVREILASHWSTVEKVSAMADELAVIRSRSHSSDAIFSEQAKLDQLQREIAKTLLQLESARARAAAAL